MVVSAALPSSTPASMASRVSGGKLDASKCLPGPMPIFAKRCIKSTSDGAVGCVNCSRKSRSGGGRNGFDGTRHLGNLLHGGNHCIRTDIEQIRDLGQKLFFSSPEFDTGFHREAYDVGQAGERACASSSDWMRFARSTSAVL